MSSNNSFEHIYHQHKNRIYYYLHTLQIPYQLHDEFYAEGMYAMWLAYKRYDESKGKLSTYLNYRIRFTMIDLIRKKEREKETTEKMMKEKVINLHNGTRNRNNNQLLIPYNLPHIHDETLWLDIKKQLTARQWKWVYYFIVLDWPLRKIAEQENVTVDTVKGWAKMTRQKLRRNSDLKNRLREAIQS